MRYSIPVVLCFLLISELSAQADHEDPATGEKHIIMTPEAIPSTWRSCSSNDDCSIGIMGCWRWIALNKKHVGSVAGIFGGRYVTGANIACLNSVEPGPQPKAICRKSACKSVPDNIGQK
jgi:hypothetical protein